jgi:hypothetical protein
LEVEKPVNVPKEEESKGEENGVTIHRSTFVGGVGSSLTAQENLCSNCVRFSSSSRIGWYAPPKSHRLGPARDAPQSNGGSFPPFHPRFTVHTQKQVYHHIAETPPKWCRHIHASVHVQKNEERATFKRPRRWPSQHLTLLKSSRQALFHLITLHFARAVAIR